MKFHFLKIINSFYTREALPSTCLIESSKMFEFEMDCSF